MKVGVELCAKMSILRVLRVGRAVHQAITEFEGTRAGEGGF